MYPISLAYTDRKLMVEQGRNQVICDFGKPPGDGQVCAVELEKSFGNCSQTNGFGYNDSAPCIYLKLNKVKNLHSH